MFLLDTEPMPDHSKNEAAEETERKAPGSSAPGTPGGVASGLQPGSTAPGGGPGASEGSIGTGGGSTGDAPSGNRKSGGR